MKRLLSYQEAFINTTQIKTASTRSRGKIMRKVLFSILAASVFTGCATDYTCGQFPSSGCQPISKVYESSNDGIYDYRDDLYEESQAKKKNKKKKIKLRKTAERSSKAGKVESEPRKLRVLIGDWEDEETVNNGGYVFIKEKEKKWSSETQPSASE